MPVPWLDGTNPTGDDKEEPQPRPWYFAMLPFLYALVFGVGGLVMIASIAAGLGAKNTKAWLISALMSLLIKVFFVDPFKVCALTAFIQYAEDYNRETLAKALEDKANQAREMTVDAARTAADAAATAATAASTASKQGIDAASVAYRGGLNAAKDKVVGGAKAAGAGVVAAGAVAASTAMDKADFLA